MKEHCHSESCCHPHNDSCHQHESDCHQHDDGCHHPGSHEDCSHQFLEVANCAWMEVLKDKIKEHIIATESDRMKELAKIIAEANHERWKHKKDKKKHCKEFEEKLCQYYSKSKK